MIYCVEDDQSIRDLMLYTLNTAGFSAMVSRTAFLSGMQ